MNHKTIRAYQFKADEAVRTLEEAGAQWVVGKGKPHWQLPINPQENLENMRMEIRKDFSSIFDKHVLAALAEAAGVVEPKEKPALVPIGQDESFQYGPQSRYEYQQHAGKKFTFSVIPSWHGLSTAEIHAGATFTLEAAVKIQKRMYSGIVALFTFNGKPCWIPVTCIQII